MTKSENTPKIISEVEFKEIWFGEYINNPAYKKYYQYDRVVFENIIIEEGVFIYDLYDKYLPDIYIKNSTINFFKIENLTTGEITITDSKIKSIQLEKSTIGDLTLSKLQNFESGYLFQISCGKLILEDFDIRENIELLFCGIASFSLQNYSKKMSVSISDWGISGSISEAHIQAESQTKLIIQKIQIGKLTFHKGVIAKDSFIQILNCDINNLYFDSVSNLGNISLQGIKSIGTYYKWHENRNGHGFLRDAAHNYSTQIINAESSITFFYSDLGKTSIIGCDLDKFDHFQFVNTKILEIFIAGTQLPTLIDITHDLVVHENYSEISLEQQRLGYSQFKKIFENRGDTVQAAFYQAKELVVYRKQLKRQQKNITPFSKEWNDNIGERINLWLNQNTNYYGNNWLKSTFVTLCATFLLFTIYCLLLGNRLGGSFDRFWYLSSYSLEFINPLRRSSELENSITNGNNTYLNLARFYDYVSRIILTYLSYQTIQAFRKFGKK